MNLPEPGTARFRAGQATNRLVTIGAAVSKAPDAEQRSILCREAAGAALVVAEAWKQAMLEAQAAYEAERAAGLTAEHEAARS